MLAWLLDDRLELRRKRTADPAPTAGQVVVDVSACGICRTDLQLVRGDLGLRRAPVVAGHQVVGRIRGGERVGLAWLASACGHCPACADGLENLCPDAQFRGWTMDGGFAQRAIAWPAFAFPLPDGVTDLEAAPLLCAGIVGYRALRLSGIRPGGRLGLYGFGSSAHLSIQVAVHWGCEVCVFTRADSDRRRAEQLGAVWTGGYAERPPAPLDAAVTFAPVGDVVVAALRALAPGARVAVNAIHLDRIPEFSYDLLWQERSITSVANFTRRDATEFLELAARIPVRAEVEVFEFPALPEALDRLEAGDIRGSAVLEVASSACG